MRTALPLLSALLLVACSSTAAPPRPLRLPATFHDIEMRESLVSGTSSRMGATGPTAVANPPRNGGPGGGFIVPETRGTMRFLITPDSVLFRSGRDVLEIGTDEITAVEEIRPLGRADLAWARVQYRRAGSEKEVYLRRFQVRSQSELLATLRSAAPAATTGTRDRSALVF